MRAQTPSNVRLIGATVASFGALAAIFAPSGKAQTFSNLDADVTAQRAAAMAVCDTIRDAAERVGCRAQRSIEFDEARAAAARKSADLNRKAAAEHQKATADLKKAAAEDRAAADALNTEARCLGTIADGLTSKRITPDDVRAARAVHPPTTDPCTLVSRLQRQLSALTKQ